MLREQHGIDALLHEAARFVVEFDFVSVVSVAVGRLKLTDVGMGNHDDRHALLSAERVQRRH